MNWLDVRFWHKADITTVFQRCSAFEGKADIGLTSENVRF